MWEGLEFLAFTLPGIIAMLGFPSVCFGVLCVYWAGHTLGATRAYKTYKSACQEARVAHTLANANANT